MMEIYGDRVEFVVTIWIFPCSNCLMLVDFSSQSI